MRLIKKAQMFAHKVTYYLAVLFVLLFLFFLLMYLVVQVSSFNLATPKELSSFIFMQRFINSPSCFSASSNNVFTPNTIDYNRFNQKTMDICFPSQKSTKGKAFRLTLNAKGSTIATIFTRNWNEGRITSRAKEVSILNYGQATRGTLVMEFHNVD